MDLEKILNELTTAPSKRLNRMAGREYAFKGPASVRVTRKDRQDILKETDPAIVKAALEIAFKKIIAATSGTPAQQVALNKINQMRKQIFDRLDK